MNEDRPTIPERVGKALSRGNLRQHDRDGRILVGPCDLDTVAALGAVGIHERLADAVYRLKYANDPRSYEQALLGVYGIACSLNTKERWRLRRRILHWMAKRVLDYWLNDGCRLCTGVGYEIVRGSPHLSDRPCPRCRGTRKLAMPWVKKFPRKPEGRKATRHILRRWYDVCEKLRRRTDFHRALLVALETSERVIGEKMVAKLARECRVTNKA